MSVNTELQEHKNAFLCGNELFTELELNAKSKPIGKLRDIDLSENEIWLLQCPKGMNVGEFENQKLKIPGRTSISDSEAISMEFNNGKEQHTFAYYNRKGHYSIRILPVSGTIVIRDRLKAAETVTNELAEKCCSAKRVPLPSTIRVRHPLLGAQYNDKIYLDVSIKKRLQQADDDSAKVLRETMSQKHLKCLKTITVKREDANNKLNKSIPLKVNSAGKEEVEFSGEEKLKIKKKNKRKHSEILAGENIDDIEACTKKKKAKETSKVEEVVSEDLQWLQNI